jgi:hypothetical protein
VARVKEEEAATVDEVVAELASLKTADSLRLRDYARVRVSIAGRSAHGDWEDLLADAINRLIEGRRAWKKSVPFVTTVIGVMRSISSNDWIAPFEKYGKYVFRDADLPVGEDDEAEAATEIAAGDTPTGEDLLMTKEADAPYVAAVTALRQHFADDQRTLDVLDAITMEMTGPETKEVLDLSQTELETIMRRIRRAAKKLFGSYDRIGKDGTGGEQVN